MPNQSKERATRVVIDTDTFNEIDDQFAVAYLLRCQDRVQTEAIYAAPFHNERSSSPGDGMERSYGEIEQLLSRLDQSDIPHFRGSESLLRDTKSPVESAAARDLIERAMSGERSDRLVVIAIGCITNIASAILMDPRIADRIELVWLAGHYPFFPANDEFNFIGDIVASRVVFDSGVSLRVMPAFGVSSHLTTSREELRSYLDVTSPLGRFLFDRFSGYGPADGMWAKEIWDVAAVAWVVMPDSISSYSIPAPRVAPDGSYIPDPRRHLVSFAYRLDRDAIFTDMIQCLNQG